MLQLTDLLCWGDKLWWPLAAGTQKCILTNEQLVAAGTTSRGFTLISRRLAHYEGIPVEIFYTYLLL